MALRTVEIDVPYSVLLEAALPQGLLTHIEAGDGGGMYDPHTFTVHAAQPTVNADREDGHLSLDAYLAHLRRELRRRGSEDAKLAYLVRESTWQHEIRHFHDLLCSPAGFGDFLHEWKALREIWRLLQLNGLRGALIKGPIFGRPAASQVEREIARLFLSRAVHRTLVYGDLRSIRVSGEVWEYELAWVRFVGGPVDGLRLPCFPGRGVVLDSPEQGLHGRLIPIGLRALVEYNAILFQDTVVRSFGDRRVREFHRRLRTQPEYLAVNMFATRIAKARGRDERDPEFVYDLFKIVQEALFRPWSDDPNESPGAVFVRALERRWASDGCALPPDSTQQDLVASANAARAALESFPPHGNFFDAVLDFGTRRCFLPAVDLYLREHDPTGLHCTSWLWYFVHSTSLPQPVMSLTADGVRMPLGDMDYAMKEFRPLLLTWITFRRLAEEALFGPSLTCPVVDGPYRDLLRDDTMRPHLDCPKPGKESRCGRCGLGDSLAAHVDCSWKKMALVHSVASL